MNAHPYRAPVERVQECISCQARAAARHDLWRRTWPALVAVLGGGPWAVLGFMGGNKLDATGHTALAPLVGLPAVLLIITIVAVILSLCGELTE